MANSSAVFFVVLCCSCISISADVQSKNAVTDNPADQLVAVINGNRTGSHSSSLYSNPGLGCIALEYIKAYQGDCKLVGGGPKKEEKPADFEFARTFAPNCGVEASTLAPITGRLLGCQSEYVDPAEAFSSILAGGNGGRRVAEIVGSKNHTEVGAGVSGSGRGGPYFWCVLFSNGTSNGSFVLGDGVAKVVRPGCFSGAGDVCSGGAVRIRVASRWLMLVAVMFLTCISD